MTVCRDAVFDFNIARVTERVVKVAVDEAGVGQQGSASEAGFEEKLIFELGEVGKRVDFVTIETIEISAAKSDKVGRGSGSGDDSMVDLLDGFSGTGDFFRSLRSEGVVIPLVARNLVDDFVVKTTVTLKSGFFFGGKLT